MDVLCGPTPRHLTRFNWVIVEKNVTSPPRRGEKCRSEMNSFDGAERAMCNSPVSSSLAESRSTFAETCVARYSASTAKFTGARYRARSRRAGARDRSRTRRCCSVDGLAPRPTLATIGPGQFISQRRAVKSLGRHVRAYTSTSNPIQLGYRREKCDKST